MEKDFDKENDLEDTLYFGDEDKSYESKQKPYSEDDMYEDYKPLTNTNSMEYDEGDYAYSNYDLDDIEEYNDLKDELEILEYKLELLEAELNILTS